MIIINIFINAIDRLKPLTVKKNYLLQTNLIGPKVTSILCKYDKNLDDYERKISLIKLCS